MMKGEFVSPRCLTITNDKIYVLDSTGRIQKFDLEGKYLHKWQLKFPFFMGDFPHVRVDKNENIYVIGETLFRVLDREGNYILTKKCAPPIEGKLLRLPCITIAEHSLFFSAFSKFPHSA